MLRLASIAAAVLTLSSTSAWADAPAPDTSAAPATLDRQQGRNGVSASLSYSRSEVDSIAFSLARLDLFAEHVIGGSLSAYGQVHAVQGGGLNGDSSRIGNGELGVALRRHHADADWVFRLGVVVPTATEVDGPGDSLVADAFASFGRFTDQASTVPDVTWLRLGASPLVRRGRWMFRVDAGIDVPVFEPEMASQPIWRVVPEPQARLNAAAVVDLSRWFVAGELTTMIARDGIPTRGNNDGESVFAVAAATAGLTHGAWMPSVTIAVPLTQEVRENLWSVTAGIRRRH